MVGMWKANIFAGSEIIEIIQALGKMILKRHPLSGMPLMIFWKTLSLW